MPSPCCNPSGQLHEGLHFIHDRMPAFLSAGEIVPYIDRELDPQETAGVPLAYVMLGADDLYLPGFL